MKRPFHWVGPPLDQCGRPPCWDPDSALPFMSSTSIIGLCRSFRELRSDLMRQAQWRAGLDKLPTSTCIAILHIDAAPLKDSLMPVGQQAIEQVQTPSYQHNHGRSHIKNYLSACRNGSGAMPWKLLRSSCAA